jgi:hypothetical protein
LTFDTGLIRNSPEFQELVKKFNPEEQRLFGEMASTWTKIPALADARFQGVKLEQLGISDRARGLEVGVFKSTQIESYFTIRDIKGRKISAEQLSKQRK